jgi:predicted dehydrogenase
MKENHETAGVTRRGFMQRMAAASALAMTGLALEKAGPAVRQDGRKIKVGVIGCGSVSGSYLPVMIESPFIELVSACDIIVSRAEDRAKQFKIPHVFPHIDKMLAGPHFDLMVNLTSMPAHYPLNRQGLEAGRHVWSEKPLAVRYEDAKQLLPIARKKNVGLWAAPITVLSPQFEFMARTLASGKLGMVTAAHAHYGHEGHLWSAWFFQKGGGSLYDLGVYNVTSLTGLLGPAKSVVGMTSICTPVRTLTDGTEVRAEVADNEMLIMDHGNGVLSHIQSGYNYGSADGHSGRTDQYTIDFWGTEGDMHLCGYDWGPHGVDVTTLKEPRVRSAEDAAGYRWQNGGAYIAERIATGKPSLVTAEHALHVLEVMAACHKSSRTGKRVDIESRFKWPLFS